VAIRSNQFLWAFITLVCFYFSSLLGSNLSHFLL
jgi:hypothetical protein